MISSQSKVGQEVGVDFVQTHSHSVKHSVKVSLTDPMDAVCRCKSGLEQTSLC